MANGDQADLENKINQAIAKLGMEVFTNSQKTVPVITGKLKRSGSYQGSFNGFKITYNTEYAKNVEFGRTGGEQVEPWTQTVPSHVRNTKKGRIKVKAHTKKYTSGKPVLMPDGQWRTFSTTKATQGRYFLTEAMENIFTKAFTQNMGLQKFIY
tara:strand:- start:609 stop:1070 length:462 start_codon:yes stop_codon:yes gene_type:complete